MMALFLAWGAGITFNHLEDFLPRITCPDAARGTGKAGYC